MLRSLHSKIREALVSILPIVIIVSTLFFTPLVDITKKEFFIFLGCSVAMIIGIGLFNLGADMAMQPMGKSVGTGLTKLGKLSVLLIVSFFMGLLITIAEPDLSVLASQVSSVISESVLTISVAVGVGLFLVVAVLKIVYSKDLSALLMFFYLLLFALTGAQIQAGKDMFIPISFDSGGVTTGPITVPFIMAMGIGIAKTIGGRNSNENSFGLIALCSIGPMIAVTLLTTYTSGDFSYELPDYSMASLLQYGVLRIVLGVALEVGRALGLIAVFFIILQITVLKLPRQVLVTIFTGIIYTFAGLVIFLSAVTIAYMPVGYSIGLQLSMRSPYLVIAGGFLLGLVTVLAEPAIHVLTRQVEEVTGGSVSKRSMLIALCLGVGVSVCLSMVRIIYDFPIMHFLFPGYLISLGLSILVPKLYTAIAFDSGGVASGPLTSGFILPFALGVCAAVGDESRILSLGFGIVAMVAMTPLIAIQLLGFGAIYRKRLAQKAMMRRISSMDDEQIINFDVKRR